MLCNCVAATSYGMEQYNPIKIEEKWRKKWEKEGTFKVNLEKAKKPYYNLMMFPYPSAEGLHIGNVYAFTGSDIHGRYMRMRGFDVFEPMGFDSFGIHSENFAIKKGEHPSDLTKKNIEYFREEQLKKVGNIFDWEHEVVTSDPDYYKWTQWLFLKFYKAGLAYRAKAPVEWCPSCKTVLADEQVIQGRCERCGSEVIQKELEQWFLRITKYAEKLLSNLENLPGRQAGIDWSEVIKRAQRNWIGRSEGAMIKFQVSGSKFQIEVFTTRPDTLFGATYMVLAPEHKLVDELKGQIENWDEVEKYIEDSRKKTELERTDLAKEKIGVELKGVKAINPANKEEVPVFIADYVLSGYGTGAIMAVPAHDQRDFEFAQKYKLPIRMVICPNYPEENCPILDEAYTGDGHLVASGEFTGVKAEDSKEKIIKFVKGEKKINYHLRDWLISRQRYWGPPIPIIYCDNCALRDPSGQGIVPVPEKDLPVVLPHVEEFRPTGTDKSPLATLESFINVACPECGGAARRETDVSDTFLDSAWYFLRYPSSDLNNEPFSKALTKKWLPVDMYIGGKEHAVLHLMYARFITMALKDLGYIDFEEPFNKFRAHGLLIRDGAKMSKSKGNVITPNDYFESYGADVLRMYLMFLGPYEQGGDWQDKGIVGIARFLKRVWVQAEQTTADGSDDIEKIKHKTIKKVTEDIESLQYNTAIASLMEYSNAMGEKQNVSKEEFEALLLMLAPFAPHFTEEIWEQLGHKGSIHNESWLEYDEKQLVESKAIIVVQVNGKVRSQLEVDAGAGEDTVKELALKDEKVAAWLDGKEIKKVIFVPDRLINFVV